MIHVTSYKIPEVKANMHLPNYVSIARGGYGLKKSPLANPIRIVCKPQLCLKAYKIHILNEYKICLPSGRNVITRMPERNRRTAAYHEIQRLLDILKNHGSLYLVCWCKKETDDDTPCHGDVIKKILEDLK